jgi:hypothetical protein
MVASKYGPRQIVKTLTTGMTLISLTFLLGIVFAKTDHGFGIALRTTDAIRPSHIAYGLEALGVID